MVRGGRQWGTLKEIRADHVNRYTWAARQLLGYTHCVDAGAGCGYGAHILAQSVDKVTAYEIDAEAVNFAKETYTDAGITWRKTNVERARIPQCDAVTAFEFIEHLADPVPALKKFIEAAPTLFGSVPNEDVVPFGSGPHKKYHFRHYQPWQIRAMLEDAGYKTIEFYSQDGKRGVEAEILRKPNGRTLVFEARRD